MSKRPPKKTDLAPAESRELIPAPKRRAAEPSTPSRDVGERQADVLKFVAQQKYAVREHQRTVRHAITAFTLLVLAYLAFATIRALPEAARPKLAIPLAVAALGGAGYAHRKGRFRAPP